MYIVFPGASSYNEKRSTPKKKKEESGLEHLYEKCRANGRKGEVVIDHENLERERKIGLQ